jgi:ABC-2 type transport system permease protein
VSKLLAISGREIRAAFGHPLAYVAIAVFLAVMGFFFWLLLLVFAREYPQMASSSYAAPGFTVNDQILRPLFGNMAVILLIVTPALSMRLFAEERRQGTMELLVTSPVGAAQIVGGKFLGGLAIGMVMLSATLPYFVVLARKSTPDWAVIGCGYLAMFLVMGVYLAVGLLMSALTDNQIIAYFLAFFVGIGLWVVGWLADVGAGGADLARFLSMQSHLEDFARGILDTSHLVYFLSLATAFLFLAVRVVESQRWR